jgi:lysozyme family protein
MTARFDYCLAQVLEFEGGWTDDPIDPGGPTNKGIILKEYAKFLGIKDLVAVKEALRHIPDADVASIYKKNYWDKVKADQLPVGLDQPVFDYAVNSGVKRAGLDLQKQLGFKDEDLDGVIGPKSLTAVSGIEDLPEFIKAYIERRRRFLRSLNTFWRFGNGWISRTDRLEQQALAAISSGGSAVG